MLSRLPTWTDLQGNCPYEGKQSGRVGNKAKEQSCDLRLWLSMDPFSRQVSLPDVAVDAVSELAGNLIFDKYCKLGYLSQPLGRSTFDLELPLLLLRSVHRSPYASSSLAAHDSCFPCCSLLSLKDLFI